MKKKDYILALAAILLAFPIIYLVIKTSEQPDLPKIETPKNTTPQINFSALEKLAQENPTFENLINISNVYINAQQAGKAIDPLKKAIKLKPNSAVAYSNLGCAYTMLKQYQNGIDACNKAVELDPNFQLAQNNLKWATDEKAKVLETIKTWEKTPENERDTKFYLAYGLSYQQIGNYDKSIEIWNIILNNDPENADALNNIGVAYALKENYQKAVSIFQRVINKYPENSLAKNNMAWVVSELKKTQQ